MSKLVWTNLSFDGIRDLDPATPSTGAVSWHDNTLRTRTPGHQSGTPVYPGSAPGGVPYTDNAYDAKGTTSGPVGNQTATRTNIEQSNMRDFANTVVIDCADRTSSQTYSTLKGSSTTTRYWRGWGTAGGWQAASGNVFATTAGTLKNGDSSYTSSAFPLSSSNSQPSGSNWDGNKWLSAAISSTYTAGGTSTNNFYLVFEGSGASTTDTDWTSAYAKLVNSDTALGAFTIDIGGGPILIPASFNHSSYFFDRTSTDVFRNPSVTFTYNRVVYSWSRAPVIVDSKEFALSFV